MGYCVGEKWGAANVRIVFRFQAFSKQNPPRAGTAGDFFLLNNRYPVIVNKRLSVAAALVQHALQEAANAAACAAEQTAAQKAAQKSAAAFAQYG